MPQHYDEIFKKIASKGTAYYRYYAIVADGTEKAYVSTSNKYLTGNSDKYFLEKEIDKVDKDKFKKPLWFK